MLISKATREPKAPQAIERRQPFHFDLSMTVGACSVMLTVDEALLNVPRDWQDGKSEI